MTYYFQAKQLCVGYQNQPLIQNIEIELKKGEILTLIGPNGAGKSTILKSIARQLELLGGSVLLEDKNLQSLSGRELAKKMAVVFTKRPHTELMTCEDVVATGRYPYTGRFGVLSAKDHEAVQEAMEAVHVLEFRDRDFAKISDGQRQRILLARAICQQPEILLLDEPTSYLDIKYKLEFLSVLQELQKKKGLTVILSLHELSLPHGSLTGSCVWMEPLWSRSERRRRFSGRDIFRSCFRSPRGALRKKARKWSWRQ